MNSINYHSSERHIFIFSSSKFVLFAVMDPQFSFTLDVFLKYPCRDISMIHASRKNRNSKNGNITKQALFSQNFE